MSVVAIDVSDAHGPALRGWGRYVLELVRALNAGPVHDGDFGLLELQGSSGPEVLWEQLGLPRALRRARPALVHSPNCFLPLSRPCPGVVTVHDLAFEVHRDDFSRRTGAKYRFFTPRALRSAQRVITVSQATRDDVCGRYRIDPTKVRVIHPAPALPLGSEPVMSSEDPYVLAVGDLRIKKNLSRLVEAFCALQREGLGHRLVLAGADAGMGPRLLAGAGAARVEFTGYIDDARLDALMRGADLLVHPSLYEGFGLVVVEAMARGVAVACSNATSLPEAAGGAAELFDPLDSQDIARAISAVLGDPAHRRELELRGLERARLLSWERTAAQTAAVYEELL